MKQSLFRRYLLLAGSVLIALYFLAPTFWPTGSKPGFFFSDGLKLGLDLQGGIHLALQVDVEEAIRRNAESRGVDMATRLKNEGISLKQDPQVSLVDNASRINLTFNSAEERDHARKVLEDQYSRIRLELGNGPEPSLVVKGDPQESAYLRTSAVDRALEILRNRIDQFGVAEPVLIREGDDRIVIQLPGLKDEKHAIELIGTTAQLEFKIVSDANAQLPQMLQQARASGKLPEHPTVEQYKEALTPMLPAGTDLGFSVPIRDMDEDEGENVAAREIPPEPILLRAKTELTGDAVVDASVARDPQTNEPNVQVRLSPTAARVFEQLTAENVNKQLAIVLDGKVKSHPNIQEKIGGGQVRITGQFSDTEAADLATVLRSGALPAPIKIIQNITVGPSLGRDSIKAGLLSGLLGFGLVCFFMAFYYRLSGIIADLALMLNNILLLGALAALDATLTLPGIAGIVLTMGMAVDSNVLIFERIREELDMGRPIPQSIRAGFDKALWTIIDSHVTTLITAFVLFEFGTGPIKGFAVTLSIGVILNLFTALVGTKVVYDHLLMRSAIKHLKFRQLIHKPTMDYVAARKFAFIVSAFMVFLGVFAMVQIQRGGDHANLGIDFAGGTMVDISSTGAVQSADARKALEASGFKDAEVQTAEGQGHILIRLHQAEGKPGELTDKVLKTFQSKFPEQQFKIEGVNVIGGAVSKDLRNASVIAVLLSLVGIVGYLAIRFDFRFGIAAAIATFHDVFAVMGFFYITWRQIDLLFVTALLTLAGYSLTDTVVVFDRIRETRQHHPTMPIREVINNSVNEVLSRTLITSSTVLLVLVALYLFGGSVLHDFSLALLLGVLVGTYSSIFVASPVLYEWEMRFGRLMPHDDVRAPAPGTSKAKA